jgi:DNA-binding NarL/FixJ family response regulator
MKQNLRIVLVDDHLLVRSGMKSLIENLGDYEVVGEAQDGHEALRIIEALQPDLVMMDISMPNLNGLDATARALKQNPNLKVIMLSMHANKRYVVEAMRAGASGYLLKHCPAEELARAIRVIAQGGKYLTPELSEAVIDHLRGTAKNSMDEEVQLTTRQREVLQLVVEGLSSREIAQFLGLSIRTVDAHRAEIMARLDIHDLSGLIRYAMTVGLASEEI